MYYCVYKDDGASGGCGQLVSITAPRTSLMIFPNEKLFLAMLDKVENSSSGRKNARIEEIFADGDIGYLPVQRVRRQAKDIFLGDA